MDLDSLEHDAIFGNALEVRNKMKLVSPLKGSPMMIDERAAITEQNPLIN